MRGFQSVVRVVLLLGALAVVAQCSESQAAAPPPATSSATTTAVAATTTEQASTTTAAPTTTMAPTTTLAATTTTTTEPEPTTTTTEPPPVIDPNCPDTEHGAVIDRARQRAWLCDHGVAMPEFVITTALDQPDPGVYHVYSKSMNATSRFGGHFSTMTHFVAFAHGEKTGARVAFHTIPRLRSGDYVQTLASVGTEALHGASSGCIRVLPEEGPIIWDFLQKGDAVNVIS